MSQLEVNKVLPQSGTTLTLGESGDTITIPSGATLSSTDPLVFPAGTVSLPSITTTGDLNTGIFFPAADTIAFTEGGAEAMRINSDGNLALTKNIGLGGATPSTSGTGITFPATASASTDANTLDDYEEGTWTPTYSTAGGGESVTYAIQSGKYTKIGNCVYFQFVLMTNSFTGGSSTIKASLPFTPSTATQVMASCGEASAWTTNCPTTTFASSSTAFVFFLRVSGTGTADITTANVTAGSNKNLINCGGFYYTA